MAGLLTRIGSHRRYLALLVLSVLALYVLLPQIGSFSSSWNLLSQPQWKWTAIAVGLTALTYFSAALTYYLLAFQPLRYGDTLLVQLAVMLVNRLLPGGVGALGGNYIYLHKKGHTPAQATVMVALNNLLGFIGHNLLFLFTVAFAGYSVFTTTRHGTYSSLLRYAAVALVVMILVGLLWGRKRILNALGDIKTQVFGYRRRPFRLLSAQLSSMSLTLANVLCLGACALSLGVHLNFAVLFLIFSFGIGAGTVTPTPGGLGGFEAGLVGGFVAYGAGSSPALAIALLYRLVSYWLPLLAGAAALVVCQRRGLL